MLLSNVPPTLCQQCVTVSSESFRLTLVEKVLILTADGRTLTGTLLSCDQVTNLVLGDTIERVIRPSEDPEESVEVSHGLYLIRGENVVVCGLVDEELDASIDWVKVRGDALGGIKHI